MHALVSPSTSCHITATQVADMEIRQAREAQARQQTADAARAAIDEDSEEAVDAATYEVRTLEIGSVAYASRCPSIP